MYVLRNMTAHEDVRLFVELDASEGFSEVVANVKICFDSGHIHVVILYPILEDKKIVSM